MKNVRLVPLLVLLLAATCDTTSNDKDPMPVPEEPGLMSFHTYDPEPFVLRVAIAPFDDPTAYRFISEGESATCSRFSRDKTKLIYFQYFREQNERRILLYDVEQDTTIYLMGAFRLGGHSGTLATYLHLNECTWVWNDKGTRFFYGTEGGVAGVRVTFSYRLGDTTAVHVKDGALPVEYIGGDTLIVQATRGEPRRTSFFLMDVRTGVFMPLDNPHLAFDGPAPELAWDDQRRLLVMTQKGEQTPGAADPRARLVLTDLDGSFFRELTPVGPYRDIAPRWGPDGTVFFTRIAETVRDDRECSSVMLVDTETGQVGEYLPSEAVEGAPHLCYPDY